MRLAWSAAAVSIAIAAPARATAQDLAAAEAHFNRGLADMQAGKYETGCPALAESQRLDPRPGRLFTLAECEAKWGRYATAVARYNDYLALFDRMTPAERAKQRGRDKVSLKARAALAPQVPELTLSLPPGAPAETTVRRDGVVLERPSLGVPLPVDPGEHAITTQAPGQPTTEMKIAIGAGEKKAIVLQVKLAPAPGARPASAAAEVPPAPAAPAAEPASDGGLSGRRVLIYTAGGLGVVGLIVGGITGALAVADSGVAKDHCRDGPNDVSVCDTEGKEAGDRAKKLGIAGTMGLGVAVIGLGAAVVLYATEPAAPQKAPHAARATWRVAPVPGGIDVAYRVRF